MWCAIQYVERKTTWNLFTLTLRYSFIWEECVCKTFILPLTSVKHTAGFGRGRGRTPAADHPNFGKSSFASNNRNNLTNNYDDDEWNDSGAQTSGNLNTPVFRCVSSEGLNLCLHPTLSLITTSLATHLITVVMCVNLKLCTTSQCTLAFESSHRMIK